jgi:hypothetical protein
VLYTITNFSTPNVGGGPAVAAALLAAARRNLTRTRLALEYYQAAGLASK